MKKLAVTMVTIAMLAVGCISASAVESPEVSGNVTDNDANNKTNTSTNANSNNSNANDTNAGKSTTSAKTGVSGSYAIFAALGVIACGGVATVAKKKVNE